MIRLFFKNLFNGLRSTVFVYLISGVVTVILSVVWDLIVVDLIGAKSLALLTVPALMITDLIIASIVSFIKDNRYSSISDRYPHIASVISVLVLIFVLLGGASAAFGILGYDYICKCCEKSEVYIFLTLIPPAGFISQLFYFIEGCKKYKLDMCSKCKHVFCIEDRSVKDLDNYSTYGYTDTTKNETIATIGSGSSKINVKADVTRRQYTETETVVQERRRVCKHCGADYNYTAHRRFKRKI